ncbi:MAG: sodium:alanine symporter family protein [Longimonas sp.]|uniref:alanine/glycine:cation symporter family protein n=1 Tax=Longimonas sp. TaxID=2039626 RepID=UPI00334B5BCD
MWFQRTVEFLNDLVWSYGVPVGDGQMIPWVVILLLGTGFYLTFQLGFIQFRKLAHGFWVTTGKYDNPDDPGDVPHFQALTTALSATVGIGNIAGVALAIHFGGPGALFWMWVTAFVGMATKYSEVTLAQFYRDVRDETEGLKSWMGSVSGGPMYYIERGLGSAWKPAAVFFAIMLIATSFLTGNAVQSNTVADTMRADFGIEPWITGLVVASVIALVILGGITRIGKVTGIVAPVMAGIYVLGAVVILALNYDQLLPTFASVFTEAFNPSAGVAGTGTGVFLLTLMYGVRRGLFSNEAGQGSAPIAHSAAKTNEPSSEGVVALLEPFIDTIIICTLTAMVILVTGVWGDPVPTQFDLDSGNISYRVQDEGGLFTEEAPERIRVEDGVQRVPEGEPALAWNEAVVSRLFIECTGPCAEDADLSEPFTGTIHPSDNIAIAQDGTTYESLYGGGVRNGAPLTQLAFQRGLSPLGDWGGYIVILSVILFAISTSISWSYYGDRCAHYLFGDSAVLPYKVIFVIMNFTGAITALTTIWTIGDIALGLVVVPNLIALIALSGKLTELTDSYFERRPWENGGATEISASDDD